MKRSNYNGLILEYPNRLSITSTLGQKRVRRHYSIPSISGGVDFAPINTNIEELRRSMTERMFFVKLNGEFVRPPQPKSEEFVFKTLSPFFKELNSRSRGYTKLSAEKFVQHYVGPKREVYDKARKVLLLRPLNRRDAHKKAFGKYEKANWTKKSDPVLRFISPPGAEYALEYGRYVKPIEKNFYAMIDDIFNFGSPVVMKGKNQSERGRILKFKYDRFTDPVAIPIDQKRFDQHVSVPILKWVHRVIELMYKADSYLKMLHRWQLVSIGKGRCTDGFFSFTVQGGLMSGEMNTSLVAVLTVCAMIYCLMEFLGIKKYDLVDDGDDSIIIVERSNLKKFQNGIKSYFLDLGFEVDVEEPVYIFEQISFCQSQPVFDGEDWIMCRNISSISKDSVSLVHWNNSGDARRWMAAVGQCGLSISSKLPIFQSYYNAYVRCSLGAKPFHHLLDYGMEQKSRGMKRTSGLIADAARVSFWRAFGICPDHQITIEDYFDKFSLNVETINDDVELPVPLPW
jgi:hypothetical protein